MLTGIHILLSYTCTNECDHCFLFCSPRSSGTFSINQIKQVLEEGKQLKTVKSIFFEGGEPLMFYPLLLEAIRLSKKMGFKVGIVSNGYPIQTAEDAKIWLEPLKKLKIDSLSISNDQFHCLDPDTSNASIAYKTAVEMGLPVSTIAIDEPTIKQNPKTDKDKGQPIVEGGTMFRGRAAENLTPGLPVKPLQNLTECPYEELVTPSRVHVDAFGNVHICQGISMGNMWKTPLSKLVKDYDVKKHPICGPLNDGGPVALAKKNSLPENTSFVDECHACFSLRKSLIKNYHDILAPEQVYGIE